MDYTTLLRIYPTYGYKSTESILYLGGNCSLGGLRLTHVLPRDAPSPWQGQAHCFPTGSSQQFSNFILGNSFYWQAPQVSPEVFSGVGEWKGRTAPGVSPLPRGQLHSTLYPRSYLPSPPSRAQLWLPHILDRGHVPEKHNGIFKTTSNTECQPNIARMPTAFTIWVQHPLILPGGSPAFFQLLLTMIPFLHVTPSSHQKLAYHDPKWSLLQSPQFQSPISHDSTVGGVNLWVASLTSTSITHKLTFNPPWAPHTRENSASTFQKGNCSSQSWLVFFPDSSLPVAHGFECWRSKLRKTELHLTKTQEVKNKQTKPWYTRQAQKLEVFAGSAYCHTSRPGRQAFFHFAGKQPQSTVSGNICH